MLFLMMILSSDKLELSEHKNTFLNPMADVGLLILGPDEGFLREFTKDEIHPDCALRFVNPTLEHLEWRLASYLLPTTGPIATWNDHACHKKPTRLYPHLLMSRNLFL